MFCMLKTITIAKKSYINWVYFPLDQLAKIRQNGSKERYVALKLVKMPRLKGDLLKLTNIRPHKVVEFYRRLYMGDQVRTNPPTPPVPRLTKQKSVKFSDFVKQY